jgi:tyrosyl-DNA phosphodiesterase-1
MDYGCHHTKMFLVGYKSGRLRVNIHTANLLHNDVHLKCQGAFLQDFKPKTDDQLSSFETSDFEEALVTYLESYHLLQPLKLGTNDGKPSTIVAYLQTYDFSTAVAVLVPSIPGYHPPHSKNPQDAQGYLKVQHAVQKYCGVSKWNCGPIIAQCSSMGSLSVPYLDKIAAAWNVETADQSATKTPPKGSSASHLKIVWPTVQEIVTSVEGPSGGGTVPGRRSCLHKPFLQLHKWNTGKNALDKGDHVPHIKTCMS